jgi:hypothetical protein
LIRFFDFVETLLLLLLSETVVLLVDESHDAPEDSDAEHDVMVPTLVADVVAVDESLSVDAVLLPNDSVSVLEISSSSGLSIPSTSTTLDEAGDSRGSLRPPFRLDTGVEFKLPVSDEVHRSDDVSECFFGTFDMLLILTEL